MIHLVSQTSILYSTIWYCHHKELSAAFLQGFCTCLLSTVCQILLWWSSMGGNRLACHEYFERSTRTVHRMMTLFTWVPIVSSSVTLQKGPLWKWYAWVSRHRLDGAVLEMIISPVMSNPVHGCLLNYCSHTCWEVCYLPIVGLWWVVYVYVMVMWPLMWLYIHGTFKGHAVTQMNWKLTLDQLFYFVTV